MPRAPDDLVSLSRLDVRLAPDASSYVQSTSIRPVPGKRSIRRDVRWQREYKHLGGGTFGQVYLEKCMEAGRKEEKRATKRIEKAGRIDYERELEALAVLSYKDEVCLPLHDRSGRARLTVSIRSIATSSSTFLAGTTRQCMSALSCNITSSVHLKDIWHRRTTVWWSQR